MVYILYGIHEKIGNAYKMCIKNTKQYFFGDPDIEYIIISYLFFRDNFLFINTINAS
jgi:hypothetical protein